MAMSSYGICAIAFSILTLLLLTRAKLRTLVPGLWIASSCMVGWGIISAMFSAGYLDIHWLLSAEVCRTASWCYCLLDIFKFYPKTKEKQWFEQGYVKAGLIFSTLILIEMIVWVPHTFKPGWPQYLIKSIVTANLLLAVFGFSLIEQLIRHIKPERRWGLKFLALGLGCMFSYDLYLFADALLMSNIDPALWQARGFVNTLVAPLIAVSIIRNINWKTDIFPSRQAVFHSTVIVSCGIYLLAMAGLGYYIRDYGGSWGRAFQAVFLVGAIVLLTSLVSSGKIRAGFKILLGKYLFQYRYDYRQEWLKFSNMLSHRAMDIDLRLRMVMALADMVESPSGVLFEKKDEGQFAITKAWNDPCPTVKVPSAVFRDSMGLNQSVCLFKQFSIKEPFGNLKDPWLVVGLMHDDDYFGFVVLSKPRIKLALNWEVMDLLKMAGRQAAVSLKQEQVSEQLLIGSQFESFNRVSAFVLHDLKNVASQIKLIQENYKKHSQNPEFIKSAFSNLDYVSKNLEKLLHELKSRQMQTKLEPVKIKKVLSEVVAHCQDKVPVPSMSIKGNPEVMGDHANLVSCITHLVSNAQEATPVSGSVSIHAQIIGNTVQIEIKDTGIGMSESFVREELFKPFSTTKGKNGMGIGVFQAREIMKSINGSIQVESEIERGTIFKLSIPCHNIESNKDRTLLDTAIGEAGESKESLTYC